MGEVIVIAVWVFIGAALVWHFAVTRRRRRSVDGRARESAEKEHTIRESRATGQAPPNIRDSGGGMP